MKLLNKKQVKHQFKEIIEKYNEGIEVKEIAKLYNTTRSVIYGVLKEYNIKPVRKNQDLTGNKYGYLTVLRMVYSKTRQIFIKKTNKHYTRNVIDAVCHCSLCGNNNFYVNPANLKIRSTTSCGCMREQYAKITGKLNTNFKGYEGICNKFWTRINKNARKRNLVVTCTLKDIWELYLKQDKKCAVTGIPIKFGRTDKPIETTASLDRIDSKLGYIKNNIQLVHKDVNIMKNSFSVDYFVNLCRMVVKNELYKNIPNWTEEALSKERFWHFREKE